MVEIGRTVTLEFTLGVPGLTEQVEVAAVSPLLQIATAEISDVLDNRQVVQMPLNGRQFLSLAQLSDAVVLPPGGTRGEALQQAGPLPNVGGQRSGHNIYLLDGTKVTDELFNNLVINPSIEPGPGSIQARRPIPQLSRINAIRFDGKSIYHGLTAKIDRRLASGVAFTASYTLSTSTDDASSPGATESEANVPQDVRHIFDDTGEWAGSSFDHRHQFIASASVNLPSLSGSGALVRGVFGGWRANAIVIVQSGAPFTVNLAVDRANVGAGPAQRPDALGDPNLPGGDRTPDRWFDTGAFALPAAFTFGSARRNSVIGPGYAVVDTAWRRAGRCAAGPPWNCAGRCSIC